MLNVVYEKDEVMCHEKITERWYEKRGLTDFPLNTVIVDQVPEELQYHCIKNGQLVFDDTRKQQRLNVFRQQDIQDTIEKLRHEIIDHLIFGEDVTEKRNTLINLLRSTK